MAHGGLSDFSVKQVNDELHVVRAKRLQRVALGGQVAHGGSGTSVWFIEGWVALGGSVCFILEYFTKTFAINNFNIMLIKLLLLRHILYNNFTIVYSSYKSAPCTPFLSVSY